mgnify:CR=1 FL=1
MNGNNEESINFDSGHQSENDNQTSMLSNSDLEQKDLNSIHNEEESLDPQEDGLNQWELININSIEAICKSQIETKKQEIKREENEHQSILASKEKQLQKQVRLIEEECGKLRQEISWLERDLSQVHETARLQILETKKNASITQFKIQDEIKELETNIKTLQTQLYEQRNSYTEQFSQTRTEKSITSTDLDSDIAYLLNEIKDMTRKVAITSKKYEKPSSSIQETSALLIGEIEIKRDSFCCEARSINQQKLKYEELCKKLEAVEKETGGIHQEIENLTSERQNLHQKLLDVDRNRWMAQLNTISQYVISNEESQEIETPVYLIEQ